MSVRIYGRVMGHGSHAQVTQGFMHALEASGKLSGVMALDIAGFDDDIMRQVQAAGDSFAEHGVLTGPLARIDTLVRNVQHQRRWVMVAPNSNRIPEALRRSLHEAATDVLVPSDWARDMLSPLVELPIHVVPHGVDPAFQRDVIDEEFLQDNNEFRVIHFSTSERERKGTLELVRAWKQLIETKKLPEQAQLTLVLDYAAQLRLAEELVDHELAVPNMRALTRIDADPVRMAQLLRSFHVVCQPSRSEAFGLIPLEALACGVPIVATAATGHRQYLTHLGTPGFVVVPHDEPAPIDDGPGALAPAVSAEAIAAALEVAYTNWPELSRAAFEAAPAVSRQWSWPAQLAPWIAQL